MTIKTAVMDELGEILEIYAFAREQMKNSGNKKQWGNNQPSLETIKEDIGKNQMYVIRDEDSICGVFSFIMGIDPTYQKIDDGAWLNDEPYGTIHRVASAGKRPGILPQVLQFCEDKIANIRIDTHEDNKIMQHILEREGYKKCGRIYVEDGSPRIAYQKSRR